MNDAAPAWIQMKLTQHYILVCAKFVCKLNYWIRVSHHYSHKWVPPEWFSCVRCRGFLPAFLKEESKRDKSQTFQKTIQG